tara:strand:- start:12964 stop:13560 length:597 start_codon:yes stop_codon:yes gene_type:complete
MKIILATHNIDKCKELQKSLNNPSIDIVTLKAYPTIGEIVEDGQTLTENAFIKSRTVFKLTNIPTISDDTGLFVDALGGKPGIYSARYAGENSTYLDNVNKLLYDMSNVKKSLRSATFKTVVTYVSKDLELVAEGSVKGFITEKPKGENGFGYDSIFNVEELNKTFAEMTMNEKKSISHRARAINSLISLLNSHNLFN